MSDEEDDERERAWEQEFGYDNDSDNYYEGEY